MLAFLIQLSHTCTAPCVPVKGQEKINLKVQHSVTDEKKLKIVLVELFNRTERVYYVHNTTH